MLLYFGCFTECDNYMFGQDCARECGNCVNNDTCHHINGSCLNGCTAGFHGLNCNQGNIE